MNLFLIHRIFEINLKIIDIQRITTLFNIFLEQYFIISEE